jgi:hypothetical protein
MSTHELDTCQRRTETGRNPLLTALRRNPRRYTSGRKACRSSKSSSRSGHGESEQDKKSSPQRNQQRQEENPREQKEKRNQSYDEDGGVSRDASGATGEEGKEGTDNILGVVRRR